MQWNVELIERDEDGLAFYLTQYKAFRLLSLQVDAPCKSSPIAPASKQATLVCLQRLPRYRAM